MKTLKWELRKYLTQLSFVLLPFALVLAVLTVLLVLGYNGNSGLVTPLSIISMLVAIECLYLILIYPVFSAIKDLMAKHSLLEKLSIRPYAIVLSSKIVLNIITVLIGAGCFLMATRLMAEFHIPNTRFLVINISVPFEILMVGTAVVLPVTANLSYLLAILIAKNRDYTLVWALAIFVVILCGLSTTVSLPYLPMLILQGIFIVSEFLLSCWLYDNKFEVVAF